MAFFSSSNRKLIDVTAEIRNLERVGKRKTTTRAAIRIKGGVFKFDTDERKFLRPVQEAIAEVFRRNLKEGLAPDGSRMKGISSMTRDWRENERDFYRRGGPARLSNSSRVSKAKREFEKRYKSSKRLREQHGGREFRPRETDGPRGVLSGMLAASFSARTAKDGNGFIIYAAGPRINIREGDNKSALERVFEGKRIWSQRGLDQPLVRDALDEATSAIHINSRTKLRRALFKTFKTAQRLFRETTEVE